MKNAPKQLLIITSVFVSFSSYVLSIMVNEYTSWTEKLACYEKCETLGFKQCIFQKASPTKIISQCNAQLNKDIIVLVLD